MSCRKFDRDEYEQSVAEYLKSAFTDEKWVGFWVDHAAINRKPAGVAGDNWTEIQGLQVTVGSVSYLDSYPGSEDEFNGAILIRREPDEEGRFLEVWKLTDGRQAHIYSCQPHRPVMDVPFFSVLLRDWPLERHPDTDLGPRFVEALRLLLEASGEARDAAFKLDAANGEGPYAPGPGAITDERNETAERFEPDPQPQDHDHPRERGESP